MAEIFNQLHVNAACLGKNDLERGLAEARKLVKGTESEWILSNIADKTIKDGKKTIAGTENYVIIEHQGCKIGIVALVDEDFLE